MLNNSAIQSSLAQEGYEACEKDSPIVHVGSLEHPHGATTEDKRADIICNGICQRSEHFGGPAGVVRRLTVPACLEQQVLVFPRER